MDPVFLLGQVLAQNDVVLWDVIASVMGYCLVTTCEMSLLGFVRRVLNGHDVDVTDDPDFIQVVTASLMKIAERQKAMTRVALDPIDVDTAW